MLPTFIFAIVALTCSESFHIPAPLLRDIMVLAVRAYDPYAWEQRKLGELLNETRIKTTIENEDILLSCAIDGIYLNSELFSHFRGQSNIGYIKIKKHDLILSAQNLHLGNCNVNLRFDHGIVSPAYKVYELIACDPLFMHTWIKMDKTKAFFTKASTEGASVCRKNIVWEDLYKEILLIPNLSEQTKIGSFFSSLDRLITLHQRKLFIVNSNSIMNASPNPHLYFQAL